MWVRQGPGSVSVSENQPLHSARTAYDAVIFDMDGVVPDTASVHARAWKALFDEVLPRLSTTPVQPFDADTDYRRYVDGRPREDGIRRSEERRIGKECRS